MRVGQTREERGERAGRDENGGARAWWERRVAWRERRAAGRGAGAGGEQEQGAGQEEGGGDDGDRE